MPTFLSNVVDDLLQKDLNLSNTIFVLPNKRAGNFFKNELKLKIKKPTLFPPVLSIEDFIYELSSIQPLDSTSLLFEFYTVYLEKTPKEQQESFESFCKWALTALQDFNEIDRHLVEPKYIFDYLKSIDRLKNWNLDQTTQTSLIEKHLNFFEYLHTYYETLYSRLIANKEGYQGIQYREAFENLQNYIETHRNYRHVFIGFNALNKAEEVIIKEFLDNELALIYWDADTYYFKQHPAATFLRHYKNTWTYYQTHPFTWIRSNFEQEKQIKIIGAPKDATQLKYVGELLASFKSYENTAIVLADESLLPMTLSSLPDRVESINITMGYELKNMPLSTVIEGLFELHMNSKGDHSMFYHKVLVRLLSMPEIRKVVNGTALTHHIADNNLIYLSSDQICGYLATAYTEQDVSFLFKSWQNKAALALDNCLEFIDILRLKSSNALETEFLYKINRLLSQLKQLNQLTGYLKDIRTLHQVFVQLLRAEKLFFQGEPLSGLQLMGMLETRVLDFDTVILTSVNEGILPVGKTDNSFIPFDVKKDPRINLPTYQERDAIFSYHFFRLIQRAKNVYLLYNTENDQYGSGEQSRFITELEVSCASQIEKYIVNSRINPQSSELNTIVKSAGLMNQLAQLAAKGVSPTSLTSYVNNPIDFYQQKLLGVRQFEEAEETIASNTLGTVIHKTLEALYTPYVGKQLLKDDLLFMKKNAHKQVLNWFHEFYKNGDISSGQNLLIYHVAQQFVLNFLDKEIRLLDQGVTLKILALEFDLESELHPEGILHPVRLIGQADRIDMLNGTIRIIDYKTGRVSSGDLSIKNWELLSKDYKFSKAFQVLMYAFMYYKSNDLDLNLQPLESGIISFRNLNAGFLKVNRKAISEDDLQAFERQLNELLIEIFSSEVPFIENETKYF